MMRSTKLLTAMFAALALAGCGREGTGSGTMASHINQLADRYMAAYFATFPENATLLGAAAGPHDRLSDLSPATLAQWQATEDSILTALQAIDTAKLPEGSAEAVTHGFLSELIRNDQGYRVCHMELWNVSPTWTGWQAVLALLANSQPIGTAEKDDAAVRRFSEIPRYLDQEMANLRTGLERGYSAPKGNVEAVIQQMDALLNAPIKDSPFVAMAPESIPDFRKRMEQLEETAIRPAILRYRDFLRLEYQPEARDAIAVSANPDGAQCYQAAIRYHATVDMTPQQVHQTGLDQMKKIRGEMAAIAERSFATSNVDAALEKLRTDRQYLMGSRSAMLAAAKSAVERARDSVPKWFGIVPAGVVEVQPVPAFSEPNAPGGFYNNGSEDGSRPGIYYINLYQADTKPRAGIEATAFHETWPGHHLQGAIALERKGLHPVQRYIFLSGFGEGWALYCERLADEMGLYTSDVDRMGLLSNEALRAARLVVDAGMHALGWSRQQAIDYMLQNTAESKASVESEVDRYIAVPGQATSYMLGNLEIRRLREEAEKALGSRFDIRAFHDRVLEDGAVPLVMLRQKIERWIKSQQQQ